MSRERKKPKKKARRGKGKAKKEAEKKEQEERKKSEELQLHSQVTISTEEYQLLKQQGELVLKMAERLAVVERALKRGPNKGEKPPAKKAKVGQSTLHERLAAKPHLIDPNYFYNWWSKRSKRDIPKSRVVGELTNMGFPKTTLDKLGPHVLSEIY